MSQSYFLYGGFVFVPLTEPYLMEWGEDWMQDAPHDLVNLALSGIATLDEEQPVILTRIFPSKRTAGGRCKRPRASLCWYSDTDPSRPRPTCAGKAPKLANSSPGSCHGPSPCTTLLPPPPLPP